MFEFNESSKGIISELILQGVSDANLSLSLWEVGVVPTEVVSTFWFCQSNPYHYR